MRRSPAPAPRAPSGGRAARAAALLAAAAAFALLSSGCASYTTRLRDLRPAVARGEFDAALQQVEKTGDPGDLLYHLERGALLHYAGRHAESNAELETAAQRLEELYTISLSQRGLSFLLNDEVEDYRGETYEGSYLHYLRLLNFLALEDRAAAAVEARRLALRLSLLADTEPEGSPARSDPFLHYLAGAVLESGGEWNNALVSYRLAREGWGAPVTACASAAPEWFEEALYRSAARAGVSPAEIGLAEPAEGSFPSPREGREGTLLLLFETGWAPPKLSEHVRLPIFRTDPDWNGEEGAFQGGRVLAERLRYRREHEDWAPAHYEVAYFLDVAVPVLGPAAAAATECRATFAPLDSAGRPGGALPGIESALEPVADLSCRVRSAFEAGALGMFAKTIARSLFKYLAAQQAESQRGKLAGLLVNLAGVATEKADTRGWLMLPARIHAARRMLPPGEYHLHLEARDAGGRLLQEESRRVRVAGDSLTVVAWRSFAGE